MFSFFLFLKIIYFVFYSVAFRYTGFQILQQRSLVSSLNLISIFTLISLVPSSIPLPNLRDCVQISFQCSFHFRSYESAFVHTMLRSTCLGVEVGRVFGYALLILVHSTNYIIFIYPLFTVSILISILKLLHLLPFLCVF